MGPTGPRIVVGLGNPGSEYAGNRHNLGFHVVDLLAEQQGARFKKGARGFADVVETRVGDERVVLAKPRSYMNESGGRVKAVLAFYKATPEQLVLVHDELDIPFMQVRLKVGGGAGGHNGVRSVDSALGTKEYARVRVGIGRPPGRMEAADFVLRDFSPTERKELPLLVERGADAVITLLRQGLSAAQNLFHTNA
ncbi:MAG TPA: aminoacyl-tRNA hydrolase [Frankiaceae bacterium]|jgi:PTH1 family peptidyl-tRNA hydrolase|nr:aminoacyl-tRNA hydrolase [Frankiaceae bacterium]